VVSGPISYLVWSRGLPACRYHYLALHCMVIVIISLVVLLLFMLLCHGTILAIILPACSITVLCYGTVLAISVALIRVVPPVHVGSEEAN
jgi:hypothetical protein